jgi:hypothetical protein
MKILLIAMLGVALFVSGCGLLSGIIPQAKDPQGNPIYMQPDGTETTARYTDNATGEPTDNAKGADGKPNVVNDPKPDIDKAEETGKNWAQQLAGIPVVGPFLAPLAGMAVTIAAGAARKKYAKKPATA